MSTTLEMPTTHPLLSAAHIAASRLEEADRLWAADLDNDELRAEWKGLRKELTEANHAAQDAGCVIECWKCGGMKRIREYSHILDGVCFACGGSGVQPFRGIKAHAAPDLRARRAAERQNEEKGAYARQIDRWVAKSPLVLAGALRSHTHLSRFANLTEAEALREVAYDLRDRSLDPADTCLRTLARRRGRCAECGGGVEKGDKIAYEYGVVWHDDCKPQELPNHATDEQCRAYVERRVGEHVADDIYRAYGIEVAA